MEDIEGYAYLFKEIFIIIGKTSRWVIFLTLALFILTNLISMLLYIFKTLSLYKMSEQENIDNKWLSCIPFIQNVILSKLAFNHYFIGIIMCIFKITAILLFLYTKIPFWIIVTIFEMYLILYLINAYKIYKRRSNNYIILTIISLITCDLAVPFILYSLRKNVTINP